MTLANFKILCEAKRKGDIKLPSENEIYQVLIQESLEYVAKECIPIELLKDDCLAEDKFRLLDEKYHLRKPIATSEDAGVIDIDEQLVYAVAYDFLANRTADMTKASFYTSKRDEEISNFKWNSYRYLAELGLVKK